MPPKDEKTELLFKHLNDKADQNYQGILSRVERLEKNQISASQMTHYATKDFVWTKFWITLTVVVAVAFSLCTGYWLVTPIIIDGKNSKLNENVAKILDAVEGIKNQKFPLPTK